jgi:hypothetical protein
MPPSLPVWGKRSLSVCTLYTHKSVVRDGFMSRAIMTKIRYMAEQISKMVLSNNRNIPAKNLMKLPFLTNLHSDYSKFSIDNCKNIPAKNLIKLTLPYKQ